MPHSPRREGAEEEKEAVEKRWAAARCGRRARVRVRRGGRGGGAAGGGVGGCWKTRRRERTEEEEERRRRDREAASMVASPEGRAERKGQDRRCEGLGVFDSWVYDGCFLSFFLKLFFLEIFFLFQTQNLVSSV